MRWLTMSQKEISTLEVELKDLNRVKKIRSMKDTDLDIIVITAFMNVNSL